MVGELLKGVCIVFYEALSCKLFLDTFMKKKSEKCEKLLFFLLVFFFMFFATITHYLQQDLLKSVAIIGTIVLFSFILYEGNWLMKVFLSVVFYGLMSCVDYLGIILADALLSSFVLENVVAQIIIVLLCKTVLFLLILFLNYFWKKNNDALQMKNSEWILMMGFPILTVVTMLFLLFSYQAGSSTMGYLTVSFGMVIMNAIMFLLLQYVSVREKKMYQLQLLQESNKEKMQAFYETSAANEFQKRILHDYGNQLNCIQGLLNEKQYNKAQEYTEKLTDTICEGMDVVSVNNPVINIILNQKYHMAEDKGIAMIFQLNDLSKVWLEEQDIVILISNLLDNAIEACDKSGDKIIRLKIVLEKKEMVVSVKNTVNEPVQIGDDFIYTTKKDKRKHGFGIKNIQMVLDKYDGMGMMRYEDGWFYYTAVIPEED